MSEKIEVLPLNTVVEIKVNGAFLTRVQALLMFLLKDLSKEDIAAMSEKIKAQTHTEALEFHYETLAILINDIEKSAKENNLTEMRSPEELEQEAKEMINASSQSAPEESAD